eukprot:3452935-Rhodomonas_salina.1
MHRQTRVDHVLVSDRHTRSSAGIMADRLARGSERQMRAESGKRRYRTLLAEPGGYGPSVLRPSESPAQSLAAQDYELDLARIRPAPSGCPNDSGLQNSESDCRLVAPEMLPFRVNSDYDRREQDDDDGIQLEGERWPGSSPHGASRLDSGQAEPVLDRRD